jgi:hypothetical protein
VTQRMLTEPTSAVDGHHDDLWLRAVTGHRVPLLPSAFPVPIPGIAVLVTAAGDASAGSISPHSDS